MSKLILIAGILIAISACTAKKATEKDLKLQKEASEYFESIPDTLIDKDKYQAKIALGKKLYFEKKLSANGTISCNSCHDLDNYGVDNEPTSPGHSKIRGERNSSTSLNAAIHFKQFWDGRAKDVEEQALGPLLNPIEHGLKDEKAALAAINTQEYLNDFKKAFPEEKKSFTFKNIGNAIGAFERTLMTPSRFDDYLNGDVFALDDNEKRGLDKFIKVGCTQCHNGQGIGGNSFQKLGLVKRYPSEDKGRYSITKKRRDKFKFKTPGLRNVTKTAPYFHDGSIETLDSAIKLMAEYQLGQNLSKDDVSDIKAFLGSLTAKEVKY